MAFLSACNNFASSDGVSVPSLIWCPFWVQMAGTQCPEWSCTGSIRKVTELTDYVFLLKPAGMQSWKYTSYFEVFLHDLGSSSDVFFINASWIAPHRNQLLYFYTESKISVTVPVALSLRPDVSALQTSLCFLPECFLHIEHSLFNWPKWAPVLQIFLQEGLDVVFLHIISYWWPWTPHPHLRLSACHLWP